MPISFIIENGDKVVAILVVLGALFTFLFRRSGSDAATLKIIHARLELIKLLKEIDPGESDLIYSMILKTLDRIRKMDRDSITFLELLPRVLKLLPLAIGFFLLFLFWYGAAIVGLAPILTPDHAPSDFDPINWMPFYLCFWIIGLTWALAWAGTRRYLKTELSSLVTALLLVAILFAIVTLIGLYAQWWGDYQAP